MQGVLADPGIGGFEVTSMVDDQEHQIRRNVNRFLADRRADDVVVVYLSCHGLLDARGQLCFAATDTVMNEPNGTAMEARWLLDRLEDCRAKCQVLILDCCFSGAFAQTKGDGDVDLPRQLIGNGRGRAVLTASRASEYSFEGTPLPGRSVAPSVFTAALVDGLRTGAADYDEDGYITVEDAYRYAADRVRAEGGRQSPQRWLFGAEGGIILARSPRGPVIRPEALPEALTLGLHSPYPDVRRGAVSELGSWLSSDRPGRVLAAEEALRSVADQDIPTVATAARAALQRAGAELSEVAAAPSPPIPPPSPSRAEASTDAVTFAVLRHRATEAGEVAVRRVAVQTIATEWSTHPEALTVLCDRAVADDSPEVRNAAVRGLATTWPGDEAVYPTLRRAATDAGFVREVALRALAAGWPRDRQVYELVRRAVHDENNNTRSIAIGALAARWPDEPVTLPLVQRAGLDPASNVRYEAIRALCRNPAWLMHPETLLSLRSAVTESLPALQTTAIKGLARGWAADPDTFPLLRRAAADPDATVRRIAIRTIGSTWPTDPMAAVTLQGALDDADEAVRDTARQALSRNQASAPAAAG